MQRVLVGVNANAELVFVFDCLQRAHATATGSGKHHVNAAVHLRAGQLATFGGVAPGGRRGAHHVLRHFNFGINRLDALGIAAAKGADQRYIHAAHKTHFLGFGRQRGCHTHKVRAFLLLEGNRADVVTRHHGIHNHEFDFGEFLGDGLDRLGQGEPDGHHQVNILAGHLAQHLLALRVGGDLRLEVANFGGFLEAFRTFVGGLVE